MGKFIQFIGACWALLGLANLVLMPWDTAGNGLLTAGLMINFLFFIMPGLGLYGLGSLIAGKKVAKGEL